MIDSKHFTQLFYYQLSRSKTKIGIRYITICICSTFWFFVNSSIFSQIIKALKSGVQISQNGLKSIYKNFIYQIICFTTHQKLTDTFLSLKRWETFFSFFKMFVSFSRWDFEQLQSASKSLKMKINKNFKCFGQICLKKFYLLKLIAMFIVTF